MVSVVRGIDYLHRNLRRFMMPTRRHVAIVFHFASARLNSAVAASCLDGQLSGDNIAAVRGVERIPANIVVIVAMVAIDLLDMAVLL